MKSLLLLAALSLTDADLVRETVESDSLSLVKETLAAIERAEANQAARHREVIDRLDSMTASIDDYFAKAAERKAAAETKLIEQSAKPAPKVTTTTCQCKGTDRGVCLCLKAGAACKCTATVGSVWQKTEAKVDLRTGAAAKGSDKPTMEPAKVTPVAAAPVPTVMVYYQPQPRWVCNGRRCFWR